MSTEQVAVVPVTNTEESFYKALVNVSTGKTLAESATTAGITTDQFINYLTDHVRISEINELARSAMEAHIPEVYSQLLIAIRRGSVNAMKLFLEFLELMPRAQMIDRPANVSTYNTLIVTESKKLLEEADSLGLNLPDSVRKRLKDLSPDREVVEAVTKPIPIPELDNKFDLTRFEKNPSGGITIR